MGSEVLKVIKLQMRAEKAVFRSLDGQSKICNWLYNHLLEKACDLKKQFIASGDQETAKILYTGRGLRNLIPLKTGKAFSQIRAFIPS
jgi:putative transposase